MKWERKGRYHVTSGPYTIAGGKAGDEPSYLGFFFDEIVGSSSNINELKAKIGRHFEITGGKRYESSGN